MEFLVCMLLASLITGGRMAQDVIATLTGNTPPHVERARLRAEREKLRAEQRAARTGGRSPYAASKPRLKDLAAVYWGDALQSAIDAHNKRREEKQNQSANPGGTPVPKGESLAKRVWKLMTRPVGEKPKEPEESQPATSDEAAAAPTDGPRIACDECGAKLIDTDGGYQHPTGSACPKASPARPTPPAPTPTDPVVRLAADLAETRRRYPRPTAACPACRRAAVITSSGWCEQCTVTRPHGFCPDCEGILRIDGPDWVHGGHWPCQRREPVAGHTAPCEGCGRLLPMHPSMAGSFNVWCADCRNTPTNRRGTDQPLASATTFGGGDVYVWPCPDCHSEQRSTDRARCGIPCDKCRSAKHNTTTEGNDDMTETANQTGSSATGDAHDLESAAQQCDLLHDDLTAIDTALDLIDEKIGSAGTAAEGIDNFLRSKNAPDTVAGGLTQARDMLSPDRIKTLMDAIAAAKAGVRAAKEAIDAMNDQATEALQGADGSIVNGR